MQLKHFHIRLNKENLLADEEQLNSFLSSNFIMNTQAELVNTNGINYWSVLVYYKPYAAFSQSENNAKQNNEAVEIELSPEENHRYETLRAWRFDRAKQDNFPAYIVATNNELKHIAKQNPADLNELINIKGFGEKKIHKYGDEIIAVLNAIAK